MSNKSPRGRTGLASTAAGSAHAVVPNAGSTEVTTGEAQATSPARHLRVVRPPTTEPPSARPDNHSPSDLAPSVRTPPRARSVQGVLPLLFVLPGGAPSRPQPARALRLVRTGTQQSGGDGCDDHRPRHGDDPVPTSRRDLPDPHRWAAALVQAAVETRHGARPVSQLVRWTSREVYDHLVRESATLRAAAAGPGRASPRRPVVRSLHLSEPEDGVVEVCSVVHDGVRSRAVAVRIEGLDGRWVCTALDVL